jgi:HD superfamily phosphohydrolase
MTADRDALRSTTDRVLQSLISGAVDADKMDYLERDSIHMGVPFGRNYDRDRLLSSLTLNGAEDGLAIWAKGKISAEIFIFCRYTMFSEAYWHHTVRSASAMVEAVLEDHVERRGTEGLSNELLTRNDDDLLQHFRDEAPRGSSGYRILAGMTGDARNLYKRIATYSRVYEEEEKRQAYQRLYEADGGAHASITARIRERLEKLVGHPIHPASLLIDTPPRDKDQLETITIRYPDAAGRDEYPLHLLSQTISGTQKDILQVVKKIRVFCDPVTTAELRGQKRRVQDALLEEILA